MRALREAWEYQLMKRSKITFVIPIIAVALAAILTACPANNPWSLFISKSGSGAGTVQSAPLGIDCGNDCAGSFPQDSLVMLTATPDAGSSFSAWSRGCTSTAGDTCVVKMSGSKTITATFISTNSQSLSVSKSGSGTGTVQSAPAGIDCGSNCTGNFPQDSQVILTATPDAGSGFSTWSGGCTSTTGNTCTVKMDSSKTITATFATTVTVSVIKNGTGSGIVATAYGKLFCGGACSGAYSPGVGVSLQAFAATGSTFSSWGGACSGTSGGSCTVTPTADIDVDATFDVVAGPALGPTQSSCDAVSVGSECDVTVTLMNGSGFRGLEFEVSSASFDLVSVGSVPAGCFASAGVKVVIACNSTIPGGGNVAVLRMMRSDAAAAVVVVGNAFVAGDATSKNAVEGGALGVSASGP